MREVQALKWLVQAAALAFFVVQMIFAIEKYLSEPTLVSVGSKTFGQLDKRIQFTVCKTGQYRYDQSVNLGYKLKGDYVAGVQGNSSILSWHGMHGNLTLNETLGYLFHSEVDKVRFRGIDNFETRFLLPFGKCSVASVLPKHLNHRHVFIWYTFWVILSILISLKQIIFFSVKLCCGSGSRLWFFKMLDPDLDCDF